MTPDRKKYEEIHFLGGTEQDETQKLKTWSPLGSGDSSDSQRGFGRVLPKT